MTQPVPVSVPTGPLMTRSRTPPTILFRFRGGARLLVFMASVTAIGNRKSVMIVSSVVRNAFRTHSSTIGFSRVPPLPPRPATVV